MTKIYKIDYEMTTWNMGENTYDDSLRYAAEVEAAILAEYPGSKVNVDLQDRDSDSHLYVSWDEETVDAEDEGEDVDTDRVAEQIHEIAQHIWNYGDWITHCSEKTQ